MTQLILSFQLLPATDPPEAPVKTTEMAGKGGKRRETLYFCKSCACPRRIYNVENCTCGRCRARDATFTCNRPPWSAGQTHQNGGKWRPAPYFCNSCACPRRIYINKKWCLWSLQGGKTSFTCNRPPWSAGQKHQNGGKWRPVPYFCKSGACPRRIYNVQKLYLWSLQGT